MARVPVDRSSQPSLFAVTYWSVSDITRRVRARLDSDESLQDCWVEGEISNLSRPASGHVYFALKDSSATLRCVVWKQEARKLRVALVNGMAVLAHGRVGVYETGGQYQLYADQVEPLGEGALHLEFLRLKEQLELEGLFAAERKLRVPRSPARIGIVTSATGAAIRDILNTLRRRMPLAEVVVAPAPVQGLEAPGLLGQAVKALIREKVDVILIARGGGSAEELRAFNDEQLVRAIADSSVPVISGVGHETDFTLCDFAADVRAPTPTAAAELATAVTVDELAEHLASKRLELTSTVTSLLSLGRDAVTSFSTQLRLVSPGRRLLSERQRLDEMSRRFRSSAGQQVRMASIGVQGFAKRLAALNPLGVLRRGYAIVARAADGLVISRVAQAEGEMHVRVSDGDFRVRKT